MPIPENQLEIWSHQGAMTTSRDTYATVKRALENPNTGYAGRNVNVFLQGSYGNDTNIYTESDVDIVICYTDAFYHDTNLLSAEQNTLFKSLLGGTLTYTHISFKADVQAALVAAFGASVQPPKKAIKINAKGNRRSADVVVAFEHRSYYEFNGRFDQNFFRGISFVAADNNRIDNFPLYHSSNLTQKHQDTGNKFKRAIRIFKNMRSKAIERKFLDEGDAPSYFVEGLLYNVPNEKFAGNLSTMVYEILNWLHNTTDRSGFVCANERHYLLRDSIPVCWPKASGAKFISAAIRLWNNW